MPEAPARSEIAKAPPRSVVARAAGLAGLLIVLGALAYVAWTIYATGVLTSTLWRQPALWQHVIGSTLLFAAGLLLVAEAWRLLIKSVNDVEIPWVDSFSIYATSQLYKYLPSNLLHHVGRYYMLRRRGVGNAAAVWGSAAEIGVILISSILVALAFGADLWNLVSGTRLFELMLAGMVVLTVGWLVLAFTTARLQRADLVHSFLKPRVAIRLLQALLLHMAFRILTGIGLWWTATGALSPDRITLQAAVALWAAAWTAGYVTPGASAGIGVREAVLIAGLTGAGIPAEQATLVALAYRLATTLGDLLFAAAGWAVLALMNTKKVAGRERV